jgi:quaternary ammonium compound-resistance protein SugE
MAWLYVLLAGLIEIAWAAGLKRTDGFTRLWPTLGVLAGATLSLWLLAHASRTLPVGTAYAVWVGIGAVGAVVVGAVAFAEPLTPTRVLFLSLLLVSVLGLKLSHP